MAEVEIRTGARLMWVCRTCNWSTLADVEHHGVAVDHELTCGGQVRLEPTAANLVILTTT